MMMKRFLLVTAYDGTNYSGYQIQPGQPTIEGILNKALSEFLNEDIKTIGASRTDAGVHSYGNIAVFDSNTTIPAEKISYALNTRLPADIRVVKSFEVREDFHPRRDVTDKTYEYRITFGEFELPTERLYSYHIRHDIDVSKMKKAAAYIEGEHDFTSFCSAKTDKEDKVRTVYEILIELKDENSLTISVRGNGFLYNMVRIIAGTLVKAGEGKILPESIPEIIETRDRSKAGPTLPAKGLFLKEIRYNS